MAICSFLGHTKLYDTDIACRLQAAADQIAAENDTVEFLLYDCGEFYDQCLLAAMKTRSRNPQKVTITLIYTGAVKYKDTPFCIFDKVFIPPIEPYEGRNPTVPFKRTARWVIRNSSHLISYVYKEMNGRVNRLFDFAVNQPLEIFPVTSEDTKQDIIELYVKLSDRERLVFEKMRKGQPQNKIAANLNVSSSRVSQMLYYGFRTIHKNLKRQYYMKWAKTGEHRKRACSIFSAGEAASETVSICKPLVHLLIFKFDVDRFYIEYAHPHSDILCAAVKEAAEHRLIHITVVTDSEEYLEPIEELEDVISAVPPSYDTLECIAQLEYHGLSGSLGFFSVMIDRADFCICDLSAGDCPDAIKNYVSQKEETVLLDIGKGSVRIDFP